MDAAVSGPYSSDGIDIGQMLQKSLMGLVSYYQGTSKYLGLLFDKDNDTASDPNNGKYYTDMEHYWDESFGYFGASADYNLGLILMLQVQHIMILMVMGKLIS